MLNIYAPAKEDILNESPDGNCSEHYHFLRAWYEAYWGQILHAYDMAQRGVRNISANRLAYEEFSKEVSVRNFGGNC